MRAYQQPYACCDRYPYEVAKLGGPGEMLCWHCLIAWLHRRQNLTMICVPHEVDTDGQPRPPRRRARGRELPEHRGNDTNVLRDVFAIHTTPHDASVVLRFLAAGVALLSAVGNCVGSCRTTPLILLMRPRKTSASGGRTARLQRIQAFEAGRWRKLLDAPRRPGIDGCSDVGRMREHACAQAGVASDDGRRLDLVIRHGEALLADFCCDPGFAAGHAGASHSRQMARWQLARPGVAIQV